MKYRALPRPGDRPAGRPAMAAPACYRVWIVTGGHSLPRPQQALPPNALAVEPAEEGTMTRAAAARYVAAFNRTARQSGQPLRAIAVPVAVRYDGEPAAGEPL
jgi:hypothetical protein